MLVGAESQGGKAHSSCSCCPPVSPSTCSCEWTTKKKSSCQQGESNGTGYHGRGPSWRGQSNGDSCAAGSRRKGESMGREEQDAGQPGKKLASRALTFNVGREAGRIHTRCHTLRAAEAAASHRRKPPLLAAAASRRRISSIGSSSSTPAACRWPASTLSSNPLPPAGTWRGTHTGVQHAYMCIYQ